MKTNYFVIETSQTENMYGYNAGIISIDDNNLSIIRGLKETFEKVKAVDSRIGKITLYSVPFNIDVLNGDFDGASSKGEIQSFTQAELDEYTNTDENEYGIDSPFLRVNDFGFQVIWGSRYTNDEAWIDVAWVNLEESLTT